MTIAERLIQKGFDEGFKKGALEVAREAACRLRDMAGRRNGFRRQPDFPVKN